MGGGGKNARTPTSASARKSIGRFVLARVGGIGARGPSATWPSNDDIDHDGVS